jgi:transcriptional regulator with XRE-family HTH domain
MRVPPPPASPTVRRRRLAAELRRLRESRDLTLDDVADRLAWSASKLSRIENAKTGVKPPDVRRLLDLYGLSGTPVDELITLAREAERKGWWEAYSDALSEQYTAFIGLEAEAQSAALWQTKMIPGLLQTEEYARQTLLAMQSLVGIPPGRIVARLKARQLRQQVLTRERPLEFVTILDESTLRRRFGDRSVMHGQLLHLTEAARLPNVTVRIRPFDSTGLPPGVDSFHLLHFGPTFHDVVYVELLTNGIYLEEDLDTYHYKRVFDTLLAQSLTEDESAELLRNLAEKVWG